MVVRSTPGLTSSSRGWVLLLQCWLTSQMSMEKKTVLRLSSSSNLVSAKLLPQRRVERRRRVVLPSTRWWPENTPSMFTGTSWGGLQEECPQALQEIRKIASKEVGNPGVHVDTRLSKAVWTKGIRNVPYGICVWLSRKCNEDEDSPNKLYIVVTCVPVTTFKNLQTTWMRTNCWLSKSWNWEKRKRERVHQVPRGQYNPVCYL